MATSSPATTRPSAQTTTRTVLGGTLHEWRQWLAPGVVVAVVLATGALQRADIRALSGKVDQINDQLNGRIDEVGGRIDRVSERIDQVSERIDQVNERIDRLSERVDLVTDQMNERFDQFYQLLLP